MTFGKDTGRPQVPPTPHSFAVMDAMGKLRSEAVLLLWTYALTPAELLSILEKLSDEWRHRVAGKEV